MKVFKDIFESIVTPERLFSAWDEFRRGKEKRQDVLQFAWRLEENIFVLSRDLRSGRYRHGPYSGFTIHDPKRRSIHKATVRDRIVHHAVFKALNPVFEPTFIPNSFSCRVGRGTHKSVETLYAILRKVSRNNTRACFALKCDIEKFFASVDHEILLGILKKKIDDARALLLVNEIIRSFNNNTRTTRERERVKMRVPRDFLLAILHHSCLRMCI